MTLEQRVTELEKKVIVIELRLITDDKEVERVKAAVVRAAKKGIQDLLADQSK